MPTYKYVVRDRSGESSTGAIEAKDPQELRRILRTNDLYLVSYKNPVTLVGKSQVSTFGARPPKVQDVVVSLRQLSTMIHSGLPVVRALQLVEDQSVSPVLRIAIKDMRETVTEGGTISAAMKRHPKVFTSLVISFVEAAEAVGNLDTAMELAAEQLDREDNMKRQVKQATLYPKFVVGACVLATFAMLMLVVPTFKTVYESMGSKLPAPTQMLININAFLASYWWLVIIGSVSGWVGFKKYRETPDGHMRLDSLMLVLPVLGPLNRKIAISRIVQTLSDSLAGGVPLLRSLAIAASTAGNVRISNAVTEAALGVREGQRISEKLEESGEFPPLVTQMIEAGEQSGNLEEMLKEVSHFYRRDVEYSLNSLTKLIEPAVTVIVGGIVLMVLIALYLPIFNLSNALQGK
jgi:type IV pilus assembly protein PilC